MCFIERETQNVILQLREIFLWRKTVLRAHGMKSDEKPFFCQIYVIVSGKMVHVVIDKYFSLFPKGLKIFLNPRLSLIVPLTVSLTFKLKSIDKCRMLYHCSLYHFKSAVKVNVILIYKSCAVKYTNVYT